MSRGWKRGDAWLSGGLVLIAALYLWELVTFSGVSVARDMQVFFLPQKYLVWDALQRGYSGLWTPYIGTGAPLLANFQSGFFYPPNWAFAIAPFLPTVNALLVFHFALGGVATRGLLRRLGYGQTAAFAAAVTFMLGGYFASLLNVMNALQSAAWAPVLAWAVVNYLERRRAVDLLALGLAGAIALLAGEPQGFLMSCGTAAVIGAFSLRSPEARREPFRLAGGLGLAVVFILGVAAIQILPTLELIGQSTRGGAGLGYEEASTFSISPLRLIHLLVPSDFRDPEYAFGLRSAIVPGPWLFSIYLGPVWATLALFAFGNRERRAWVATWTLMGAVGLIVSMGGHTPVFPWLYEHVPGVSAFRFPEKYFFFTGFAASMLAAAGLESLPRRASRRELVAGVLFLIVLVALRAWFALDRDAVRELATSVANPQLESSFDFAYGIWAENLSKLLLVAGLTWGLIGLHRRGRIGSGTLVGLTVALLAVDLTIAHRDLNPTVDPSFYQRGPEIARHFPLETVRRDFRYRGTGFEGRSDRPGPGSGLPLEVEKWRWQQTIEPNLGQLFGVLQQDSWDAIGLQRSAQERELYRVLPEPWRRWKLLRLSSVRYMYSERPLAHAGEAREIALDSLPGRLYELDRPLPRAYVVPEARRYADHLALLNGLLGPDFDPTRQVALLAQPRAADSGTAAREGDASPDGPTERFSSPTLPVARIVGERRDEVRVAVDDGEGGYLVLTDTDYPGWSVEVDGQPREVLPANFRFRAVGLEPGDREVVFRFRSLAFERGRLVTLITLAVAALFGVRTVLQFARPYKPFSARSGASSDDVDG